MKPMLRDEMSITTGLTGRACDIGYTVLEQNGAALIGMSVGNSYFKQSIIDHLLVFCDEYFSETHIFITDVPSRHTFEAMGYNPDRAESKARHNGNALRNRCKDGLNRLDLNNKIHFVDWDQLVITNDHFLQSLQQMKLAYTQNTTFYNEVNSFVQKVITNKLKPGLVVKEAVTIAARYIIEELAFLSVATKILEIEKLACIYHRQWSIFERFVAGEFDGKQRNDLGLVVVCHNSPEKV